MGKFIPIGDEQGTRGAAAGATSASTESAPAFDQAGALACMDDDHDFLRQLSLIFLEEAPMQIAEIRAAIEQENSVRLERAAHKLKGSSYPFCAAAVIDSAQTLESLGASGQMAAARAEYPRFEIEVGRLQAALKLLAVSADRPSDQNPDTISGREQAKPCTA